MPCHVPGREGSMSEGNSRVRAVRAVKFLFAFVVRIIERLIMIHSRLNAFGRLLPVLVWLLTPRLSATPGGEMASAATNLLNALSADQKAQATYGFTDEERFDWHFIPKARKGLPFKAMTPAQQKLAHALLSTGLSQRGYLKAVTIMSLEQILHDLENGKGPTRDSDLYYFTIFGLPETGKAWGWRVEGHHVSLNFVVRDDEVLAATPAFFGSNPAEVKSGPRQGLNILGEEESMGRAFVRSLSADQQKIAVITTTSPREIITGNSRKAMLLNPPGLAASQMNQEQKDALLNLIKVYAHRHRSELAETDLKKIRNAGFDKVCFAWAGGLDPGQGHYYRVQGPTFVLEFDDTQDNANHIHTVWRDFANDFGDDVLLRHYEEVPHAK